MKITNITLKNNKEIIGIQFRLPFSYVASTLKSNNIAKYGYASKLFHLRESLHFFLGSCWQINVSLHAMLCLKTGCYSYWASCIRLRHWKVTWKPTLNWSSWPALDKWRMLQPFTEYTKAVPINLQRSNKVWGRVAKRLDDGSTAPASPCPRNPKVIFLQVLVGGGT